MNVIERLKEPATINVYLAGRIGLDDWRAGLGPFHSDGSANGHASEKELFAELHRMSRRLYPPFDTGDRLS